jgi:hypothetical protein
LPLQRQSTIVEHGDAMPKTIAGKKVLTKFGSELLDQLDQVAEKEQRTRSELIREAVRRYIKEMALWKSLPVTVPE